MPLPVLANTYRVAVEGITALGTRWTNVIHLKKTSGTAGPSDLPAIVTELNKLYGGPTYGGGGLALLSSSNAATQVQNYRFTLLDGTSASSLYGTTAAGTGVATSLPAEVAEVVTLRTPYRGRRNRGRIYLPPFTVTNINANGSLAAGVLTGMPIQCAGFQTALGLLTYSWVVASYQYLLTNSISSFSMDAAADVQRRRKA